MIQDRETSSAPYFKEIQYKDVKEINYLNDIGNMGPRYVSFLQSLNYNELQQDKQVSSFFDNTIDKIQKKVLQGALEHPNKVSRKNKKGDSDINYYNANDSFINDDQCGAEKKDKQSCYEDFACVQVNSIQQLYASSAYCKIVDDLIVETGKRKAPQQFTLKEDHEISKFDQIKKLIGNRIMNNYVDEPQIEIVEKQPDPEQNIPAQEEDNEVQIIVHPPIDEVQKKYNQGD